MPEIAVSPTLVATAQPDAATIANLAGGRFAGIVNVRPDGEETDQIGHEETAKVARKAGSSYAYVPVTAGAITEADIRAFQRAFVAAEGLSVAWILDTHPHADHFSAAAYLKAKTGAPTAISARVTQVNIRGGRLPEPEDDGTRYLNIPLDALPGARW
ncbi:MAG: MBL fold metallo-hydrolase [Beijerinckiaceae bacterium]|nr:MBL fold metallo-hydrolase [Beijerinckiaceae bacterium]